MSSRRQALSSSLVQARSFPRTTQGHLTSKSRLGLAAAVAAIACSSDPQQQVPLGTGSGGGIGAATTSALSGSTATSTVGAVGTTGTTTSPGVCVAGQLSCGGLCVNSQTDPQNCGGCNLACAAGEQCLSGICACPVGQDCGVGPTGVGGSTNANSSASVTSGASTTSTATSGSGAGGSMSVTNTSNVTNTTGGATTGGTTNSDYPCDDTSGYDEVVTISGSNARATIQAAVDGLSSGRNSKQSVLVQGNGSMSASERISLPSYTVLNVCGTINVTGTGSGDNAPVYARGQTDIEIPNLSVTGSPNYGMFFRNVNNIHLGNIDLRLSSGLGIRVDNHGGDRAVKATNLRIDNVYVEGGSNHGVETYGVDGITIGTVVARNTGYAGLLLNDSINAEVGLVDADGAGTGTGYAAFRMANRNGRVGSSYPTNIHVGQVIARGGGRGIFCVSESGGVVIDRIDIEDTGGNSILLENCYNVNIAAIEGSVTGGGDIRIAARTEFANSSDITIQNLTVTNSALNESPCADNSNFLNNTLVNSSQGTCD